MRKKFSDIREQIEILKKKNLSFQDENKAVENIIRSNYYIVINGYRGPFLKEKYQTERSFYIDGSTFEEIYALYMFDRSIRSIFLKYILIFEQNIKSAVSYEFSKLYGSEDYLRFENFEYEKDKNIREIFYLIGSLHNSLSRSIGKNEYITYNIEKYNHVPLWVLANVITFGSIINFYKVMKEEEKRVIAKKYFRVKTEELEGYMELLKRYRNICAHDERLYDQKLSGVKIPINEFHSYFSIHEEDLNGKNDVFALLVSLATLLSKEDEYTMIEGIVYEFEKLDKKIQSISMDKIYSIMGFPKDWKKIQDLNF